MAATDNQVKPRRGPYLEDQIVVATEHVRAVGAALKGLGITFEVDDDDDIPELGLSRIGLPALRVEMRPMRQDAPLVRYAERWPPPAGPRALPRA